MARSGKKARVKDARLQRRLNASNIRFAIDRARRLRSSWTAGKIQRIRDERRQKRDSVCLLIAERECRQQEKSKKYLDPRRRNLLPARLLPRNLRAVTRDFHRLPYRAQRLSKGDRPVSSCLDSLWTLIIFWIPLSFKWQLEAIYAFTHILAAFSEIDNSQRDKLLQSRQISHTKKSFAALRSKHHAILPGLPIADNTSAVVEVNGTVIAAPINYQPLPCLTNTRGHVGLLAELQALCFRSTPLRIFLAKDGNDDDDYEYRPPRKSGGTKRKSTEAARTALEDDKPKPKKRGRKTLPIQSGQEPRAISPTDGLTDPGLPIDSSSPILQQFLRWIDEFKVRAKTTAVSQYTPVLSRAMHVRDLPLYDPDRRQYVLMEDEVALVRHKKLDKTSVLAWRLRAINKKKQNASPVELFTLPRRTTDPKQTVRHNIIDESICGAQDREKVIELGKIKVDIMNRMPGDLDISQWEELPKDKATYRCPQIKSFLDLTALCEWKKSFMPQLNLHDLPSHPEDHTGGGVSMWDRSIYTKPRPIEQQNQRWRVRLQPGTPFIWCTDKKNVVPSVKPSELNQDKLRSTEDLDSYYLLGSFFHSNKTQTFNTKDAKMANTIKALQHVLFSLVGMVGTSTDLSQLATEKVQELCSRQNTSRNVKGPFNGAPIWWAPLLDQDTIRLTPSTEVVQQLQNLPTGSESKQTKKPLASIRLRITDRACLAYVFQQSLNALVQSESILNMLWSACVAAQKIESGYLTRQQVLEQHCDCGDDPDVRSIRMHYCMSCFKLRACVHLVWVQTANGIQLLCVGCSKTIYALDVLSFANLAERRLMLAVTRAHQKDSKSLIPTWTIEQMFRYLVKEHFDADPTQFVDGYSEASTRKMSLPASYFQSPRIQSKSGGHQSSGDPHSMSVEKPHDMALENGKLNLHALSNVTIVKDCINRLKGSLPPSVLPLLKRSFHLHSQVKLGRPRRGYDPAIKAEREKLDTAFDHIHVIQSLSHLQSRRRVEIAQKNLILVKKRFAMEKSGVWDQTTLRTVGNLFRTNLQARVIVPSRKLREKHPTWTKTEWKQICKFIDVIEQDTDRDNCLNPDGLKIPRKGAKKDVPWLWREDHCPEDVDGQYIYEECLGRLETWTGRCDPLHECEESPLTLFLEECVQWLETGGKCHIFGFVKTIFVGHPSRSSWGRAITQRLENGQEREISPGEHMKTGWKVKFPKSLDDYDITRRTVVNESWRANSFRWAYTGGTALIKQLEKALDDLGDTTKWYSAIAAKYPKIPVPASWKDRKPWISRITRGTNLDDIEIDITEDEAPVDEEVVGHQERIENIEEVEGPLASFEQSSADEWIPPSTEEGIETWVQEDNSFLDSLNLPEDQKQELRKRYNRVQSLAKQKLLTDIARTPQGASHFYSDNTAQGASEDLDLEAQFNLLQEQIIQSGQEDNGKVQYNVQLAKDAIDSGDEEAYQSAVKEISRLCDWDV